MESLVAWFGFAGGWLLVAGPVLQAALELADEEEARRSVEKAMHDIEQPPPLSPWWWLLPPVRLVIQKRRSDQVQRALTLQMAAPELENLIRYFDKARGWFLVGAGATLIAVKETWELVEHYEWPTWLFWTACPVMFALALANTMATLALSEKVITDKTGVPRRHFGSSGQSG